MCSIMGYLGSDMSVQAFRAALDQTVSRGPDMQKICCLENGYLGFNRLAIMDLQPSGMQPFTLNGDYVACNGEIYGFRKIRKGYAARGYVFESNSDCEVLLPMYREMGVDMFKTLDAEFALIIYDGKSKSFVAARDPLGIRPLFYGYRGSGILFASEAKNLMPLTDSVYPFPPGHYYKDGEFVRYANLTTPKSCIKPSIEEACANIREKLVCGIEKRLDADAPLGFLLSGGLDSSLVCAVAAKKLNKPIKTFAIGMEGDAIDLKYAREAADYLHSDHEEIIMTKDEVLSSLACVIKTLETYDITTIRASIGMYLICKAIHERSSVRVLLTGEISDELFGYKYTDFAPNAEEFQKESKKRIDEIYMYDVLRADRCISAHSLEARVPFGDLDFVRYVMSLDPAMKMNVYGMGKYLLRKAFEGDYLPKSILYREKAAFSDAVGHSMVDCIKEYAEAKYSDERFEREKKRFSYHAEPFTKESLLYRSIFEKHYPGQAGWVKDYWMPNKSWEGCDVNDPSARVLKNYGNSGK